MGFSYSIYSGLLVYLLDEAVQPKPITTPPGMKWFEYYWISNWYFLCFLHWQAKVIILIIFIAQFLNLTLPEDCLNRNQMKLYNKNWKKKLAIMYRIFGTRTDLVSLLILFFFLLGWPLQKSQWLWHFVSIGMKFGRIVIQVNRINWQSWMMSHFQNGGHDAISCTKVLPPW